MKSKPQWEATYLPCREPLPVANVSWNLVPKWLTWKKIKFLKWIWQQVTWPGFAFSSAEVRICPVCHVLHSTSLCGHLSQCTQSPFFRIWQQRWPFESHDFLKHWWDASAEADRKLCTRLLIPQSLWTDISATFGPKKRYALVRDFQRKGLDVLSLLWKHFQENPVLHIGGWQPNPNDNRRSL